MRLGRRNPVPRGHRQARVTARPIVRLFFRKYPVPFADPGAASNDPGWVQGRIRFRVLQIRGNSLFMSEESEVEASSGIALVCDPSIGVRVFDTDYFPTFVPVDPQNDLRSLADRLKDLGYIALNDGVDTLQVHVRELPVLHQYETEVLAFAGGSRSTAPDRPPDEQVKELLDAATKFQFDRSLLPTGIDNREIAGAGSTLVGLENRPSNAANVRLATEVQTSHANMVRHFQPLSEDPAHPYGYQTPHADPRDRRGHRVSPLVSAVTCLSLVRFESLASDIPSAGDRAGHGVCPLCLCR